MKRILHVAGGMNIGGTETMLMNVYRNINRDEVQYDFISYYSSEGYYDKEIKELGGKVINLPSPNSAGPIRAVKDLCKVIKLYGPYEAVHCHTLFNCGLAVLAAYLTKVKVRISHAHTTADEHNYIIRKLYIAFMRALIRIFSTNLAACSESAANYLFGDNINSNKKYIYLPNYIEYRKFLETNNSKCIKDELNLKENEKIVGHVGRFIDAKNHDFLVEIIGSMIKKDNNIRGMLVGDGVLKNEIELKVKKMGLENKICFLGLRKDIPEILSCMDLFIFPSIYEGLGLVLLEAQAAGLPCLVSEAIQPEADLEIDLIKRLNISEGIEKWADEALHMCNTKQNNKDIILRGFEKKGYALKSILNKLSHIYNIKGLERSYEKGINSVL
jgi:glycosyltransferase involved in cell wall biosynthesis